MVRLQSQNMSSILSTVLTEVGWDTRFAIPEPTAENRALIEEIERKQKQLLHLQNKRERNKDQKKLMLEFLRNLRQELENTQALCKAKEREVETEKHLTSLAERELGRLTQENIKMENELKTLADSKSMLENQIFNAEQRLEDFRLQMDWDKQTLEAFLKDESQKHEDMMAIAKYAKEDESRIKSLTLAIEKATAEASEKRRALDKEKTECMSTQLTLDKTTESLQQEHLETQQIIQQWENTIRQLKQRDDEMQQCSLKLAQDNEKIRDKSAVINEKKSFLDTLRHTNKDLDRKIVIAKQQAEKLRRDLKDLESDYNRLQDEVNSQKSALDRVTSDVDSMMSKITKLRSDIEENNKKLEQAKLLNNSLGEKLKDVMESALSEEERAAQLEQFLKNEEENIKALELQMHSQRKELVRLKEQVNSLKRKEKDSLAHISKSKFTIHSLTAQLKKMEKELIRQQMIMSEQDTQIACLERKLGRLQGDVESDEKQVFEQKIAELDQVLEEKRKTALNLSKTLKESEDSIRYFKKELETSEAQKKDLGEKLAVMTVQQTTTEKLLKKLRLKKQDNMVEHNILKMKVKHMRDLLHNKADSVLSLEKRKLSLQRAMKERIDEIRMHRETLNQQLKMCEKDRRKVSVELNEKMAKIELLKNRYELVTLKMGPADGEAEKSQAYFITKAAQEKGELKIKGDTLDAKIQKMELENRALENTNLLFDSSNSEYRKTLNKANESSKDYQVKVKLEEQLKVAKQQSVKSKKQVQELQLQIEEIQSTIEGLEEEERVEKKKMEEKQLLLTKLKKEISSQEEKIERAKKQCAKLTKEVRSAQNTKEETLEEKDIKLKQLKEFSKNVEKMLCGVMEENPELRSVLEKSFVQANLPLPAPAPSTLSSRGSKINVGSSLSSQAPS
ncbi:coiled-coil domain-containing protein 39 [Synchiropus splendidus]|uniref:coiled-coil domain-containing protein 39 n=1 Tax=Synchiropus splendidus TaxID=270530 RepID=UPI00237ED454|nr:coiled-coil domain-containing protein 39 [Synchiropus splendidus]